MYKKLQLHALPTDKVSGTIPMLLKGHISGQWQTKTISSPDLDESVTPHYLYLTSNDEINEGDWTLFDGELRQVINESHAFLGNKLKQHNEKKPRKIVATNNPDLWDGMEARMDGKRVGYAAGKIGEIPQSLIEYVVKQQGNVKEVLVELYDNGYDATSNKFLYNIKPNTSGEIIWKPVEERMYTKKEVSLIALGFAVASFKTPEITFEEWFEKQPHLQ